MCCVAERSCGSVHRSTSPSSCPSVHPLVPWAKSSRGWYTYIRQHIALSTHFKPHLTALSLLALLLPGCLSETQGFVRRCVLYAAEWRGAQLRSWGCLKRSHSDMLQGPCPQHKDQNGPHGGGKKKTESCSCAVQTGSSLQVTTETDVSLAFFFEVVSSGLCLLNTEVC